MNGHRPPHVPHRPAPHRPPFWTRERPPPWWPEGEHWPPHGGKGPAAGQRYFVRRVWLVLGVLLGVSFVVGLGLGYQIGAEPNTSPERSGPPGFMVLVFLIVLFVVIRRFLKRTAGPIAEVMAAARRVADGDYSVRVKPNGNRDVRGLTNSFNQMISRLQANETLRRNLLADVAHELRTPLSVIRGTVEGMLDGVYPRDDSHLTPILDQTDLMSRLLDDLRTFSLVEAGVFKLHHEPTEMQELIDDLIAAYQPRAQHLGVTLRGVVPPMPEVEVDPVRLRQVLENLLTNALRYTPLGGTIAITVGWDGRAVYFTVRDTGVGIAPEHLPHLFERFWKSADSGGSGLGLAIAKTLVEAHGGQIHADSTPGEGTTLRIQIPVAAPASVRI